ncbi:MULTISPECIES: type VI immunity family protein, partial [unclassified Janthinobacterium]|uniref:type VI immunity family protein n=1 Tax=unclassified Janthinobacterium TaxID=2610881 RepID=UPI00055A61B7
MSTTERFFSAEDVEGMVKDLKEWPNMSCDDGNQDLGVSPFITFYFLYDTKQSLNTSLLMVDIHEEFERLTGKPYLVATHPDSERPHPYGSKRIPDLRDFSRKRKSNQAFIFDFSDQKNHNSSPSTAGYFWKTRDYMNDKENFSNKIYSSIQFYYRWSWWRKNKNDWKEFILLTMEKLKADQVYSGFAMANPLAFGSRSEVTVWERALTPRFFGLDIDYQFSSRHELTTGIRPPTWGFLLSDFWREKLDISREQVKTTLHHPQIRIDELNIGLWIELGEEPSLYPVEDGVPELPVLLNKLLRPIRHDHMGLLGFGQWDGDPNERFTNADELRWVRRFDTDSDWPSAELRQSRKDEDVDAAAPAHEPLELRAHAGEACPKTGQWQALDIPPQTRRFEQGEVMSNLGSAYGLTVWRFLNE